MSINLAVLILSCFSNPFKLLFPLPSKNDTPLSPCARSSFGQRKGPGTDCLSVRTRAFFAPKNYMVSVPLSSSMRRRIFSSLPV